jgi:uncharacterized membrane protein YesL
MGIFKYGEGNKLQGFLGRLADVVLLNFLWLAACLPLVTIGAATTAACAVALKMVDDEEGYIVRSFFREFKSNFLKASLVWLLNAVALYVLYIDWQLATRLEDPPLLVVLAGIISVVFFFCAFVYAYPLLARYETGPIRAMKNSMRISIRYPGRTFIILLLLGLEIAVFTWNGPMLVAGALAGPMILIYTVCGISKRLFQAIDRGRADGTGA